MQVKPATHPPANTTRTWLTCESRSLASRRASDINPCQTNWPKWVEMWNSERVGYDCANNSQIPNEPGYGHWSQVVWSGTRYLGCALRCGCREDHGTWFGQFLVCHYGKTGNILGKRPFSTTECKYHLGGGGDDGGSYNVACEEHGVGLYDSNMGSVVVPGVMTAKACAETCRHEKEHGCRHFTFYDGCWLHWGSTGKRPTGGSLVASMSCLYPDDFKSAPDPPQKRCDQVNVQAINPVMVVPGKIAGAATPWECAQACKNYEGYGCQFFQLSGYDCLLLKSAQALQWADGHTFGVLSCYGLT